MDDKIFELAAVMPVMLMGAPGVGKTTVVTDFARRIGADLLDVRLLRRHRRASKERTTSCRRRAS